jgi:hypothetical protein
MTGSSGGVSGEKTLAGEALPVHQKFLKIPQHVAVVRQFAR